MMDRKEINLFWANCWEKEERPGWQVSNVNFYLKRYFKRFINDDASGKRILVPLCGATMDMVWLYKQGLAVVGVELSEIAIKKFFAENNLSYSVAEPSPHYKIYTHDARLQIFQIDLFQISSELLGGKFHFWLDRGALVAMVEDEQEKYAKLIKSLMNPNASCLMECFEYDEKLYTGTPRSVRSDKVSLLFGKQYDIEELVRLKEDEREKEYDYKDVGFDSIVIFYLLKGK